MSVHDIIHDLHPALQSDDLEGKECHLTTNPVRNELGHRKKRLSRTYLEDDDPGVDDVVEADGAFVGVGAPRVTPRVVLVPVDAQPRGFAATVGQRLGAEAQGLPVEGVLLVQAARAPSLAARRHIGARHDAVVGWQRADEGTLVILLWLVVWGRQGHA